MSFIQVFNIYKDYVDAKFKFLWLKVLMLLFKYEIMNYEEIW